jgi:MbtH protein
MPEADVNSAERFEVVVNHEDQYSVWPAEMSVPGGWTKVGKQGPRQECLDYINDIWTDMRPLSLRRKMQSEEPV